MIVLTWIGPNEIWKLRFLWNSELVRSWLQYSKTFFQLIVITERFRCSWLSHQAFGSIQGTQVRTRPRSTCFSRLQEVNTFCALICILIKSDSRKVKWLIIRVFREKMNDLTSISRGELLDRLGFNRDIDVDSSVCYSPIRQAVFRYGVKIPRYIPDGPSQQKRPKEKGRLIRKIIFCGIFIQYETCSKSFKLDYFAGQIWIKLLPQIT